MFNFFAKVKVSSVAKESCTLSLMAALLLGVVNAFVRPIAIVLTLPISVVTLGLFLLVVNAGMLALVAYLVPGFDLLGFWPALWAAIVVGLTSWVGSWFIGPRGLERLNRL